MRFPFFPDQASTMAPRVDLLYFALTALSAVMMAIIFLPMFYFLYKYRGGNPANRSPLRFPMWRVEVTWSVIPLILLLGVFGWATDLYFDIERPPAEALEINVIGKQWMWKL